MGSLLWTCSSTNLTLYMASYLEEHVDRMSFLLGIAIPISCQNQQQTLLHDMLEAAQEIVEQLSAGAVNVSMY